MFMINKGTSHNSFAMCCLRELFWLSAIHNFHLTSKHIAGVDNVLSDYISRLDVKCDWLNFLQCCGLNMQVACHMSPGTLLYLQTLTPYSGQSFNKNARCSRKQHMLIQPSQLIPPCEPLTSDSAYTSGRPQCQPLRPR